MLLYYTILTVGDLDAAVESLRTFLRTHFTDFSLYTSSKEPRPVPLHRLFVNMEWEIEDETSSEKSDETSNSEEDPPSEESKASDSDSTSSSPDCSVGNPNIQSNVVMWEWKEDVEKESPSNITTKDEPPVLRAFLKTVCIILTLLRLFVINPNSIHK